MSKYQSAFPQLLPSLQRVVEAYVVAAEFDTYNFEVGVYHNLLVALIEFEEDTGEPTLYEYDSDLGIENSLQDKMKYFEEELLKGLCDTLKKKCLELLLEPTFQAQIRRVTSNKP